MSKQVITKGVGGVKSSIPSDVVASVMDKIDESLNAFNKQEIQKSVNEDQRLALFVALPVKDETLDEYDNHNDSYSAEEVRKAMLSFNTTCNKTGLYHLFNTDDAEITQSFLAPTDMTMLDADGEVREIKKGSWLQEWHFPETEGGDVIWGKVKDGELCGISVQCSVIVEDVE